MSEQKSAGYSGQISDLDIRPLRILKSVIESGGFSAADVELNFTVAAISIAVSDLERRPGMKLYQPDRFGFTIRYAAITRRGARPNLVLQTLNEELEKPENDQP